MSHFKWYTWVGIGLVFFILTITLGKMTVFIKDIAHTEAISVEVLSEAIDAGIQLDTENKDSSSFSSTITIPYTNIPEIDQTIHEWKKGQEKKFHEELEEASKTLFRKSKPANIVIESDINKLTKDIVQIKLMVNQTIGDQHRNAVKTIAFHQKSNKLLNLDDVIRVHQVNMDDFQEIVKKFSSGKIDNKFLSEELSNINEINWQLNVKEQQLTVFINKTAERNQIEKVSIPFLEMYKLIKDKYYALLISDEIESQIANIKAKEEQKKMATLQQTKKIALTFDDGPHESATSQILDALDQYDAKATFFMLGRNVKLYPEIARDVANRGHEIANHSITHANLNAVNYDQKAAEVLQSQNIIEEITGVRPTLFRPPYGNYTDDVVDLAVQSKQSIILWSIDTRDWHNPNANVIYYNILQEIRPGSIILMHDIHLSTANTVPKILKSLTEANYEFVTVSELLPHLNEVGVGPYYGN